MIPGPLKNVDKMTLLGLKQSGTSESTALDFKLELPDRTAGGSKEFLKDLSAFANTQGGDLVFGVQQDEGIVVDVPGVEVQDPDAEQNRLEQIALSDGIEPRLPTPEFQKVEISTGRYVFLIRVPQSWNTPHRLSFQGHGHFYARGAATSFAMNVQQLREAFVATEARIQRIVKFRDDRLRFVGGNAPVRLVQTDPESRNAPSLVVLHLAPLQSFTNSRPEVMKATTILRQFTPLGYRENDGTSRPNLDGRVNYAGRTGDRPAEYWSYTQIFRNGCVEAVRALPSRRVEEHQFDAIHPLEGNLRVAIPRYLESLRSLGFSSPIYLFLSLRRVMGKHLTYDRRQSEETFDSEHVTLPEIEIESLDTPVDDVLRPVLDVLWNAVGHDTCPRYDEQGRWLE